jgi:quinoprotein glucose dehydrogenase
MVWFVLGCGAAPQPIDNTGPVGDWPEYGGDLAGQRYSALNQITRSNVAQLNVAWTYHSGDAADGRGDITATSLQVTPIVVDSTLYFCTPFNRVIALDPEKGTERWTFDPKLENRQLRGGYPLTCRGVSAWTDTTVAAAAPCSHRIFTGTQDAQLIALDGRTGQPCAGFGNNGRVALRDHIGDAPIWEYYVTSPPLIVRDLVIVGALVADNIRVNAPPGVVRAFDARTGVLKWAWDPIPPGVAPLAKAADNSLYQRGTANVWSIMAADPQRDLMFVPTGNAPPDYYGVLRQGLDYWSSSIVALRASTGQPIWRFQTVHHDLWDYDVAAQPTLLDVDKDGQRVSAVLQPTKMGHLFLLNRVDGVPLYAVEEKPVPQTAVAGESLSPTQPVPTFPVPLVPAPVNEDNVYGFTFWDRGKCRALLRQFRNDGLFTPPTVQGSIHFPSAAGGVNWGSGAVDRERGLYIVNQSRVASIVQLVPRAFYDSIKSTLPTVTRSLPGTTALFGAMDGTPYAIKRRLLLSPLGAPCNKPPWGTLTAVDLKTGQPRWEVPLGTTRDMAPGRSG